MILSNRQTFTTAKQPAPWPPTEPPYLPPPSSPEASSVTISQGAFFGIFQELALAVRNERDWLALWQKHAGSNATQTTSPAPAVDFSKEMGVAIFAGQKASGGYSVNVDKIEKNAVGEISVDYTLAGPGKGCAVITVITAPFHMVKPPASTSALVFKKREIFQDCPNP